MTDQLASEEPSGTASPSGQSAITRHRRGLIIAGGLVLAIAASVGIGAAVASGLSGHSPAAIQLAGTSAGPDSVAPGAPVKAGRGIRGTIVGEAGTQWTVRTKSGKTVIVTITSKTKFGTKTAPSSVSEFGLGAVVVINGTASGTDAFVAKRIVFPQHAPTPSPTASG